MKKTVVIVGAGYMAEEYSKVLIHLKKKYSLEVSGIYSRTFLKANNLKKKYKIRNCYNDLNLMMKIVKPSHVIVAVSEISTLSVCKILSKYNAKILIEKPCGYNEAQSKKISKIYNKNKYVYLALNRRYFNSTIKAKKLLKKNEKRNILVLDQQEPNRKRPKKIQDNWMYANSIHLIDYLLNFSRGKIKKIFLNQSIKNIKNVSITFSSGDVANYKACWGMPGPWGVIVNTKSYYIKLMPLENLEFRGKSQNTKKIKKLKVYNEKKFKPGLLHLTSMFLENRHKELYTLNYNLKLMNLIKKIYFG